MGMENQQKPQFTEAAQGEFAQAHNLAEQNLSSSESNESLGQREKKLRGEIAEGIGELDTNIENIEALAEDEHMTPPLRERLLSSIDTISNRIQNKFLAHLGGTAVLSGIVGLQEYLVNTGQSVIEEGSILGDANGVVLAGLALYASIKGIQFAGYKIKEFGIKKGIKKGTVEGGADAAYYIEEEADRVGLDVHNDDLDVSRDERRELKKEESDIFRGEGFRGGPASLSTGYWSPAYTEKASRAFDRTKAEASKLLAQ